MSFDDLAGSKDAKPLPKLSLPPKPATFIKTPILRAFSDVKPLFELIAEHRGIIAGGYARYCCSPKDSPFAFGDIDVFLEDGIGQLAAKLSTQFDIVTNTGVTITLAKPRNYRGFLESCPDTIQLIEKPCVKQVDDLWDMLSANMPSCSAEWYAKEVMSDFDLTVSRAAILDEREALVDSRFVEDEKAGKARVVAFAKASGICRRLAKYRLKGYSFDVDEMVSLFGPVCRSDADMNRVREIFLVACYQPKSIFDHGDRYLDFIG